MCRARFLFFPSSPFLSSIHSEALILKMMLFFPTSCLSNEVLISGLQLSSQQGEDEVRRSWEKWRAGEQCGGNNAHLCSSGLLGNGGCTQLPGKITCPKTLGRDAQRKEGGEGYPSESGPPPICLKRLPLVPAQAVGKGRNPSSEWGDPICPLEGTDPLPALIEGKDTPNTDTLLHA